jgi:hydroxybutyrate-dimer hydrolase
MAGSAVASDGQPAAFAAPPIRRVFDGRSDDLLSGGLGARGLRGPAPGFADPLAPTALELRRRAIWTNYRALADLSEGGGFGRLSGPRKGERIAGIEYLAAVRRPGGNGIATVMLQIPSRFDAGNPCLVAVASSGSRGIYGALPTAGEWGLRKGCAVVHTDKGTGTGFHDLDGGITYRIDLAATAEASDSLVTWRAKDSPALAEWRRAHPHRIAVRHAHSGDNSERDWGHDLIQAVQTGFILLQKEFPEKAGRLAITPKRTLVIASGISNGGGAALRAVEADDEGLFDGAVVSEPNIAVVPGGGYRIAMGTRAPVGDEAPSIFDHSIFHYLLQPAAVLAPDSGSPMTAVPAVQRPAWEAWSARLAELGLVRGASATERGQDARRRIEAMGVLREAQDGGAANVAFGLWPAIAEAYASAYARLGPEQSPCGMSYSAVDAAFQARALSDVERSRLAADSSGVPPTAGVQLVDGSGRFASLGTVDHALCLRELATGNTLAGTALPPERAEMSRQLRAGIDEVRANARIGDRPVIVLHGRLDALIPVNFSSRAWYARHRAGGGGSARYYEVEHGHHFDAFNALPGWGERFVPMQPQLLAAMDLMHAHLADGRRLPPSQVLRSHTRRMVAGQPEPVTPQHLGPILAEPAADEIEFRDRTLRIPE